MRRETAGKKAGIVKLSGFHLSPHVYGGRPVFVIDDVRYYMASKHRTAQAAREGADGKPVVGKYLNWYLRLYRIPAAVKAKARR